jgi:hypothetical protein
MTPSQLFGRARPVALVDPAPWSRGLQPPCAEVEREAHDGIECPLRLARQVGHHLQEARQEQFPQPPNLPKTRNRLCKTVCRGDMGPIAATRGLGARWGSALLRNAWGTP